MTQAEKIVQEMMAHDSFSQWLGIEVLEVKPGYVRLKMEVRHEMTNGLHIAHGGITYSLADSALAFAANGYGHRAVSIDTSIAHLAPVIDGETLFAEAKEQNMTNKIGLYDIEVSNKSGKKVAIFRGTVYKTPKEWDV